MQDGSNLHLLGPMLTKSASEIIARQDFSMADIASKFRGGGGVGNFCPGDALRQAKDEVIIFTVLGSRAIIRGGVSPEGGYNLADNFIQRVETSKNIGEVYALAQSMFDTMKERVQRVKEYKKYSPPISESMEYIELNILNRICLNDVAAALGYSTYYISRRFKEETGVGMNSYIRKRKVERSKEYMENSELSLSEISERLSFPSQSYFSSVFRQETGMSPSEYMRGSHR